MTGKYLHNYIAVRAAHEGVGYDLTINFFSVAIEGGIRTFFGVEVDDDGYPIEDVQKPTSRFLLDWQKKNPKQDKPGRMCNACRKNHEEKK